MPTPSDIESLFKRFGGDAERYHEIRAEADAEQARTRWPLLGLVELHDNAPPESMRPASSDDAPARFDAHVTGVRTAPDAASAADGGHVRDTAEPTGDIPTLQPPSTRAHPVDNGRAGHTDRPSGMLKKLFARPAAPDAARTPDPSEPLLRVFDRLRAEAPEQHVIADVPARTIRR
ncbi:hypothetical protein KTD30_05865 [Burkholderia multivorans]|uniref:cellulose biosynthesis protein BcsP n=1 Tax=Burkholderia multivorans TaxID=87883 RepID=UPI000CFEDC20|nr:cellulose biosynthesis protein BcsP [Burkholderia multivorans]MBU9296684.1 hypothetical protein [Burkholderia multivorans]PRH32669.1 hypothetical protein C6T53_02895 [Burkholderia multivorans]